MKAKSLIAKKIPEGQLKRFADAKKRLRKIQEELAPFTKKKTRRRVSSISDWRSTSDVINGLD